MGGGWWGGDYKWTHYTDEGNVFIIHPSFAAVLKILQPLQRTFAEKKVAWMDEQAGDFLAFIMAELITMRRSVFFLTGEEGRELFLAFSPMAQWESPNIEDKQKKKLRQSFLTTIALWERGAVLTAIKKGKVCWRSFNFQSVYFGFRWQRGMLTPQNIRWENNSLPHPSRQRQLPPKQSLFAFFCNMTPGLSFLSTGWMKNVSNSQLSYRQ